MYYKDRDGKTHVAQMHRLTVDGCNLITWEADVDDEIPITVEAGTNGRCGEAGRTYIRVTDWGMGKMRVARMKDGFSLSLNGEAELEATLEALRWILSVLEVQTGQPEKLHSDVRIPPCLLGKENINAGK